VKALSILIAAALALGAGQATATGDAARGEALYESRCTGCHALDDNRVGPKHRGVYGRRAGSVADFDYSPALKRATVVWDTRTLDRWLADPERFIHGQKMGYQVADAQDRADLIAYLKRESGR
jgi:cytochrome c